MILEHLLINRSGVGHGYCVLSTFPTCFGSSKVPEYSTDTLEAIAAHSQLSAVSVPPPRIDFAPGISLHQRLNKLRFALL